MRKLILEMIHRLPVSEIVRPYVKSILALMLKLLRTDNEDNVLVCLRIIIDLHKQYRPTFHPEVFLLTFENLNWFLSVSFFRSNTLLLTSGTFTQTCPKT